MKLPDIVLIFLLLFFGVTFAADELYKHSVSLQVEQKKYSDIFQSSVDDAGVYLSRFESQQQQEGIRYQREKQVAFDPNLLNIFYDNLALKLGIEGDDIKIQDLMLHIPAMVVVRYDGYSMVTVDANGSENNHGYLTPTIWPFKPFTYTLENGNVIYFTLDNQATVYDTSTNTFINDSYENLYTKTNLAPLYDLPTFERVKSQTITQQVQQDLASAINRHEQLIQKIGLAIKFSLPAGVDQQSISNTGFFAFIQGYPLPGGELLTSYSFGGGGVSERSNYVGTILTDGRHMAYGTSCVPSSGAIVIEKLHNSQEAAKKGYFVNPCTQ
jgi:hypothetical protein